MANKFAHTVKEFTENDGFPDVIGTIDAAFIYLHTLLIHDNMPPHKSGKEPQTLIEQLHVTLRYLGYKTTFCCTSLQFQISIVVTHSVL